MLLVCRNENGIAVAKVIISLKIDVTKVDFSTRLKYELSLINKTSYIYDEIKKDAINKYVEMIKNSYPIFYSNRKNVTFYTICYSKMNNKDFAINETEFKQQFPKWK